MNNEEKILSMLEILTTTTLTLVNKIDRLEQSQAKLEQAQNRMENELSDFRQETNQHFDKLEKDIRGLDIVDAALKQRIDETRKIWTL